MFEKASMLKLTFKTQVGVIKTEDLWDLNLEMLDTVAKSLSKQLKESEEESFIKKKSSTNCLIELKFNIVKHIIKYKLEKHDAIKQAAIKRERKAKILQILANKQDESLNEMSIEDLTKELDSL